MLLFNCIICFVSKVERHTDLLHVEEIGRHLANLADDFNLDIYETIPTFRRQQIDEQCDRLTDNITYGPTPYRPPCS